MRPEIARHAMAGIAPALALAALIVGCGMEREAIPSGVAPDLTAGAPLGRAAFAWSEPVWLGPLVNSAGQEAKSELSPNGLSLFFDSNRPGGFGGFDIWVARRAHLGCPWGPAENLGPAINTAANEGEPDLSPDGNVLLFASNRAGGYGGRDIYVSRRSGSSDDQGWGPAVNLGDVVNTIADDAAPELAQGGGSGGELYFHRGTGSPGSALLYVVAATHAGEPAGTPVQVHELDAPGVADGSVTVRGDGRELIFWSGGAAGSRPGSVGLADLWVSTRSNASEPWSAPRNLGRPVNHAGADLAPDLSADGRTLIFSAQVSRGGLGLRDLWMSTRGPQAEDPTGGADISCGS